MVGILWGIIFTEGLRVIMLCNWHFDIFWPDHWRQAMALWKAGWVVRAPKEWAFVLLIITYIPMLLTGWWTLSLVAWEEIIYKIITLPYTLYRKFIKSPMTSISTNNHYGIVKRKSYKQIRPAGINTLRVPISDYGDKSASPAISSVPPAYSGYPASALSATAPRVENKVTKTDVAATIDHALFKFDDDEDDFDLDIDSFEKADLKKKPKEAPKKQVSKFDFDEDEDNDDTYTAKSTKTSRRKEFDFEDDDEEYEEKPRNSRRTDKKGDDKDKRQRSDRNESSKNDKNKRDNRRQEKTQDENNTKSQGPVYDALVQKNYDIISNVSIKGTVIDFVGVSENSIYLCLVDKETGDWLADEEMFNGEDPLWFSESSHRVSPVCLLNNARNAIKDKLEEEDFEQNLEAFVIVQMANIINADDMFEIWGNMDINVTRINRGSPKEIRLFSRTLPEAESRISKKELERLSKLLKSQK